MKQLKPRDKITQKMTRDGAVEINETQQTAERISSREADRDFSQPDTATAERVIEHLDAAHTRKASKKAVKKAQEAAVLRTSTSRLQFTDEERATPELETYIKKSEKAADKLDAAKAAIPKQKKLVKERTFEETTGKAKTRLYFEEQDKPIPGGKAHSNLLSRPAQEAGIFVHNKIHSVEKDNSGVEGAHKSEELAERGTRYGTRKLKQGYRSHKLKPYREAAKAEKAAFKANVNFQYHKALQENPQLTSNPFSRFIQKQKIKRQYVKPVKKGGAATAKAAAGVSQTAAKKAAAFAGRHPAGVIIAIAALLLFIMVSVGLSLTAFTRNDNGQPVFPAQLIAHVPYAVVAALIGIVLVVVNEIDCAKNDVVMDMPLVYVGGKDVFVLSLCCCVGKLLSDCMGFLTVHLSRFKRLYQMKG